MANEDRITGFEYVGATPLTEEQYSTQFVNFYNQFLGLPTLEEETGVEVETGEDITQLRQMTPGGGGADEDRNVLGPGGTIQFQDISIYDGSSASSFQTYKDSLQASGLGDRVPFVENIVDPLMAGDLGAVKFGEQTGVIAEQKAAELKETLTTPGIKTKIAKAAPKAMAGVTTMVAPGLFGAGVGGLLTGKSFVNAFGKPSFRPGGILGAVTDFVATRQYNDINAINAAIASGASATGFAMTVGNMGITRAPGSGAYTGNMQGMTHKQVKAMEALSKGFTPSSYNMQEETGKKLEDEGYKTGRLSTGGYYQENGTYMDAFGNTSYMGLEKDLLALAQKYNISEDQASMALSNARRGNGTLSENLSGFATPVVGMSRPSATAVTRTKYDVEGGTSSLFGPGPSGPGPRSYEGQAFNLYGLEPGIVVGGTDLYTYKAGEYPSTEVARLSAEGVPVDRINQAIRAYGKGPEEPTSQPSDGGDKGPGGGGGFERGIGAGAKEIGSMQKDVKGYRGGYGFADGGRIGLQAGGMAGQSGFVQRPPSQVSEGQTVADNVNTSLPEGAFVINAAAVEFAGESDIKKMLLDANKEAVRRGLTVDKQGNGAKLIDVAISQGEVVVSPHLAKIIGYDRLEKINNRGKGETQQRIQENGQQQAGRAEGGFLSGVYDYFFGSPEQPEQKPDRVPAPEEGFASPQPDVGEEVPTEQYGEIPQDFRDKLNKFAARPRSRTSILNFVKSLPEDQALAFMLMTETVSNKADLEEMEAVAQVAVNRANSNYRNFKHLKTVQDVITQQTARGAPEFAGLDKSDANRILKDIKKGLAEPGLKKAIAAAQNVLSGEMEMDPVVSPNTLYYTLPEAQSQWMREHPEFQFSKKVGPHEFYEVK